MEINIPFEEAIEEYGVPICGSENACEIVNEFLDLDELPLLKKDIQNRIAAYQEDANKLQKELIKILTHIARLENNLQELQKFKSSKELTSSLYSNFTR